MFLGKKVFDKKWFRNLKNGGLDQVKTELRPMGVPKNLPKEFSKIDLKHIFKAEELLQSNKLSTQTCLVTLKIGGQKWIKLTHTQWGLHKNCQ